MVDSAQLRGKCAIVGVGEIPYTRGTDKSVVRLNLDAACNAIADAGLSPQDIDGYSPYALARVILEPTLNEAMKEQTTEEWLKQFETAGIHCGSVNTIDRVVADSQVAASVVLPIYR